MPSALRKIGKYWQYDNCRQPPNRVRVSLKTGSKEVAKQIKLHLDTIYLPNPWLQQIMVHTVTVQKFLGEHVEYLYAIKSKSWAIRQHQALRNFIDWIPPGTPVDQVESSDIEAYITFRMGKGVSPRTVQIEIQALHRAWIKALRDDHTRRNPFKGVEMPKAEIRRPIRPFSRDEVARILQDQLQSEHLRSRDAAAAKARYPFFATLWYTGLRAGDVMAMQVDEFDLDAKMYERRTQKTGKHLRMPLATPLVEILHECLLEEGPAFPKYFWDTDRRRKNIESNLNTQIKRILDRLGISHASLHSFRHGFNQRLFELGLELEDRQALLGHSAGRTTKLYTHPNEDLARRYLDKL